MKYRLHVSCILKRHTKNVYDAIEALGGLSSDGSQWWLSAKDAIEGLEHRRWKFFVEDEMGNMVPLVVAATRGHKYLKAESDTDIPKALLSLPEGRADGYSAKS